METCIQLFILCFKKGSILMHFMTTNIVNLTKHEVVIEVNDNTIVIKPHGTVCRVVEETKTVSSIDGIPVRVSRPVAVEGLPPQKEGVVYFCSGMAAAAAWSLGRTDVFCPSTDEEDIIRNERGLTVAIKALKGKPKS